MSSMDSSTSNDGKTQSDVRKEKQQASLKKEAEQFKKFKQSEISGQGISKQELQSRRDQAGREGLRKSGFVEFGGKDQIIPISDAQKRVQQAKQIQASTQVQEVKPINQNLSVESSSKVHPIEQDKRYVDFLISTARSGDQKAINELEKLGYDVDVRKEGPYTRVQIKEPLTDLADKSSLKLKDEKLNDDISELNQWFLGAKEAGAEYVTVKQNDKVAIRKIDKIDFGEFDFSQKVEFEAITPQIDYAVREQGIRDFVLSGKEAGFKNVFRKTDSGFEKIPIGNAFTEIRKTPDAKFIFIPEIPSGTTPVGLPSEKGFAFVSTGKQEIDLPSDPYSKELQRLEKFSGVVGKEGPKQPDLKSSVSELVAGIKLEFGGFASSFANVAEDLDKSFSAGVHGQKAVLNPPEKQLYVPRSASTEVAFSPFHAAFEARNLDEFGKLTKQKATKGFEYGVSQGYKGLGGLVGFGAFFIPSKAIPVQIIRYTPSIAGVPTRLYTGIKLGYGPTASRAAIGKSGTSIIVGKPKPQEIKDLEKISSGTGREGYPITEDITGLTTSDDYLKFLQQKGVKGFSEEEVNLIKQSREALKRSEKYSDEILRTELPDQPIASLEKGPQTTTTLGIVEKEQKKIISPMGAGKGSFTEQFFITEEGLQQSRDLDVIISGLRKTKRSKDIGLQVAAQNQPFAKVGEYFASTPSKTRVTVAKGEIERIVLKSGKEFDPSDIILKPETKTKVMEIITKGDPKDNIYGTSMENVLGFKTPKGSVKTKVKVGDFEGLLKITPLRFQEVRRTSAMLELHKEGLRPAKGREKEFAYRYFQAITRAEQAGKLGNLSDEKFFYNFAKNIKSFALERGLWNFKPSTSTLELSAGSSYSQLGKDVLLSDKTFLGKLGIASKKDSRISNVSSKVSSKNNLSKLGSKIDSKSNLSNFGSKTFSKIDSKSNLSKIGSSKSGLSSFGSKGLGSSKGSSKSSSKGGSKSGSKGGSKGGLSTGFSKGGGFKGSSKTLGGQSKSLGSGSKLLAAQFSIYSRPTKGVIIPILGPVSDKKKYRKKEGFTKTFLWQVKNPFSDAFSIKKGRKR